MSLEQTFNGRTYNGDDYDASTNPTGLGRGGARILWNQLWSDIMTDIACQMQMACVDNITIGAGPFDLHPLVMRGVPVGQEGWVIADSGHKMFGAFTAKTSNVLTFLPSKAVGSGSFSSWTIQPSGPQGPQGIPGLDYTANAMLALLAVIAPSNNSFAYINNSGAGALATLTPFARTLLDDPDAATAQATLGFAGLADINALAILAFTKG